MNYFKYNIEQLASLKTQSPALATYIDQIGMIERESFPNLFDAIIRSIIGQQISVKAAHTVYSKLNELVGTLTPKAILEASKEEIQACGMTFRKTEYLTSCAQYFIDNQTLIEHFDVLSDADIIKHLSQIYGVGKWTVQMVLIFSMNRMDVVSYDDLMIRKGIEKAYGIEKLTKKQFNKIVLEYSPYGSIASLYLWKISRLE